MSVIFWLFALMLLLYMAGVRVNWQAGTVRSTASIYFELAGKSKESVEYILNGQSSTSTTPVTIGQLSPGAYTLTVRQADHQEWHRSFKLAAGEAANFTDILLVPTLITPRAATTAELKLLDNPPLVVDDNLRLNGGELYLMGKDDEEDLILRLSEDISQALWLPDKAHILLIAGQTAALVEVSGTNMTSLFTVPAGADNHLYITKDGATVLLKSGDAITAYDIANPSGPFWTKL